MKKAATPNLAGFLSAAEIRARLAAGALPSTAAVWDASFSPATIATPGADSSREGRPIRALDQWSVKFATILAAYRDGAGMKAVLAAAGTELASWRSATGMRERIDRADLLLALSALVQANQHLDTADNRRLLTAREELPARTRADFVAGKPIGLSTIAAAQTVENLLRDAELLRTDLERPTSADLVQNQRELFAFICLQLGIALGEIAALSRRRSAKLKGRESPVQGWARAAIRRLHEEFPGRAKPKASTVWAKIAAEPPAPDVKVKLPPNADAIMAWGKAIGRVPGGMKFAAFKNNLTSWGLLAIWPPAD